MGNKTFNATVWYVVSSFLTKGIAFLSVPLFSRMLTTHDFGIYSNYTTWYSILTIIMTLCLQASLVRGRFDYADSLDSFVGSLLLFGSFFTILLGSVLFVFSNFFCQLFVLEKKYLYIMVCCILVSPAYEMFMSIQRFRYKYKLVTLLSLVSSILSIVLSFFLISAMTDKLLGRVIGAYLPSFVVSLGCYYLFLRKTKFSFNYCKYALVISIPYIFHLLSGTILNGSDKAMITNMCGAEKNAIYSMAYNVGIIVSVIWASMNNAYAPYIGECINEKKYNSLKQTSKIYLLVFAYIIIGIMLLAPEILWIMGGDKYAQSIGAIPPVMLSYYYVFVYSLYVNIEQYEKKTLGMAIATCLCALLNLILNYIFIGIYGYIAAAYTTLICYFFMAIVHYLLVKKMDLAHVYDTKFNVVISGAITVVTFICLILYKNNIVRFIVVALYLLITVYITIRQRKRIIPLIKGLIK